MPTIDEQLSAAHADTVRWRTKCDELCRFVNDYGCLAEAAEARAEAAEAEVARLRRCYFTATGKVIDDEGDEGLPCGEGAVVRIECRQMTDLRARAEALEAACRRALGWCRRGNYERAAWELGEALTGDEMPPQAR